MPLLSAESAKVPKNAKIAVVTVRDAGWFTVCPVFSKEVVELDTRQVSPGVRVAGLVTPVGARVEVVTRPPVQHLEFWFDDTIKAHAVLPVGGRGVRDTATVAPDQADALRLRTALRAKGFAAVDALDEADFVLVVETRLRGAPNGVSVAGGFRPSTDPQNAKAGDIFSDAAACVASRRSGSLSGGDTVNTGPPTPPREPSAESFEWEGDWRESMLAVLVRAGAYRDAAGDPAAMVRARIWQGMVVGERQTFQGKLSATPASFESVAEQLRGKGRKYPAGLPVCAVPVASTQ